MANLGSASGTLTIDAGQALKSIRSVSSALGTLNKSGGKGDPFAGIGKSAQAAAAAVKSSSGLTITVDTKEAIGNLNALEKAAKGTAGALAKGGVKFDVDTKGAVSSVEDVGKAIKNVGTGKNGSLTIDTGRAVGNIQDVSAALSNLRGSLGNFSANVEVSGVGTIAAAQSAAQDLSATLGSLSGGSVDFSGAAAQLSQMANDARSIAGSLGSASGSSFGGGGGGGGGGVAGFLPSAAIAGGIGAGLKMGWDNAIGLEQALTNVEATLGNVSTSDMSRLSKSIIQIGVDSQYSGVEIAGISEQLAKAGYGVKQQIDGNMLSAVVNLATATGTSLPESITGVTQAMAIWSPSIVDSTIAMTDASKAADILTVAANASSADVGDIIAGVRNLGPIAAQMHVPFEQVAGAVAMFTNYGLKGADAGVSLARGLQNLNDPTSEASQLMGQLGINVFDAQGSFVGFPTLFEQLHTSMAGMTDQQKLTNIGILFGAEAQDVFTQAIAAGKDPLLEIIKLMDNEGLAAEQAAKRQDTLHFALQRLTEGLGTTLGSLFTPFLGPAKAAVDLIANIVSSFSTLPAPIRAAAGAILILIGAFAGISALSSVIGIISGITAALGGLSGAAAAGGGIAAGGGMLAGLTAALPVIAVLAVAGGAAILAYKQNFLGFGDTVDGVVGGVKSFTNALTGANPKVDQLNKTQRAWVDGLRASGQSEETVSGYLRAQGVTAEYAQKKYDLLNKSQRAWVDGLRASGQSEEMIAAYLHAQGVESEYTTSKYTKLRQTMNPLAARASMLGDAFDAIGWNTMAKGARGASKFLDTLGDSYRDLRKTQNPVAAGFGAIKTALFGIGGDKTPEWATKLGKGFEIAQGAASTFGKSYANLRNTMNPVSAALGATASVLTQLGVKFPALQGPLSKFASGFTSLSRAAQDVGNGIQKIFSGDFSGAMDSFGKAFGNIKDAITSNLGGLGDIAGMIAGKLGNLGGAVWDWASAAFRDIDWGAVAGNVKEVASTIVTKLGNLGAALGIWAMAAFNAINWSGVWNTVQDATGAIVGKLGNLGAALGIWAMAAFNAINWSGVWNTVQDATGEIVSRLGELGGAISTWVFAAASGINWSGLWNGVQDATATIVGKLGQLGAAISLWVFAAAAGINWSGLWNGVTDATATIVGKLGNLGEAVKTWATTSLSGINWGGLISSALSGSGDAGGAVGGAVGGGLNLGSKLLENLTADIESANWDSIGQTIGVKIGEGIGTIALGALGFYALVGKFLGGILRALADVDWGAVTTTLFQFISAAVDALPALMEGLFKGIWTGLSTALDPVISAIKEKFGSMINDLIRKVNDLIGALNKLNPGSDIPKIPLIQTPAMDVGKSFAEGIGAQMPTLTKAAQSAVEKVKVGSDFGKSVATQVKSVFDKAVDFSTPKEKKPDGSVAPVTPKPSQTPNGDKPTPEALPAPQGFGTISTILSNLKHQGIPEYFGAVGAAINAAGGAAQAAGGGVGFLGNNLKQVGSTKVEPKITADTAPAQTAISTTTAGMNALNGLKSQTKIDADDKAAQEAINKAKGYNGQTLATAKISIAVQNMGEGVASQASKIAQNASQNVQASAAPKSQTVTTTFVQVGGEAVAAMGAIVNAAITAVPTSHTTSVTQFGAESVAGSAAITNAAISAIPTSWMTNIMQVGGEGVAGTAAIANAAISAIPTSHDTTLSISGADTVISQANAAAAAINAVQSKTVSINIVTTGGTPKAQGGYVERTGSRNTVARMGELGPELLRYPNGKTGLAPSDGYYSVPAGTFVYTAAQTKRKLKDMKGVPEFAKGGYVGSANSYATGGSVTYDRSVYNQLSAIAKEIEQFGGRQLKETGKTVRKMMDDVSTVTSFALRDVVSELKGADWPAPKTTALANQVNAHEMIGVNPNSAYAKMNTIANEIEREGGKDMEGIAKSVRDMMKEGPITQDAVQKIVDDLQGKGWAGTKTQALANSLKLTSKSLEDASGLFSDETWMARAKKMGNPNDVADLFGDRTKTGNSRDYTLSNGKYTEHYGGQAPPTGVGMRQGDTITVVQALDPDSLTEVLNGARAGTVSNLTILKTQAVNTARGQSSPVRE